VRIPSHLNCSRFLATSLLDHGQIRAIQISHDCLNQTGLFFEPDLTCGFIKRASGSDGDRRAQRQEADSAAPRSWTGRPADGRRPDWPHSVCLDNCKRALTPKLLGLGTLEYNTPKAHCRPEIKQVITPFFRPVVRSPAVRHQKKPCLDFPISLPLWIVRKDPTLSTPFYAKKKNLANKKTLGTTRAPRARTTLWMLASDLASRSPAVSVTRRPACASSRVAWPAGELSKTHLSMATMRGGGCPCRTHRALLLQSPRLLDLLRAPLYPSGEDPSHGFLVFPPQGYSAVAPQEAEERR